MNVSGYTGTFVVQSNYGSLATVMCQATGVTYSVVTSSLSLASGSDWAWSWPSYNYDSTTHGTTDGTSADAAGGGDGGGGGE